MENKEFINVENNAVNEENTSNKPSFFTNKKLLFIIGGAVAAVLLVIGIIFTSLGIKSANIKKELAGKTFEEVKTWELLGSWSTTTYSFSNNGNYHSVFCHYTPEDEERFKIRENDFTAKVKATLSGKAYLTIGADDYELVFDEGEITGFVYDELDWEFKLIEESSVERIKAETAFGIFKEMTKWKNQTFGGLIPKVFKEGYEYTYLPVESSNTEFIITVKGDKYIVKEYNITEKAEFSVKIDINTGKGEIVKDDGVIRAMEVYIATNTNWWS